MSVATPSPLPADAPLLRRVQQHNQEQIIAKLLHDLRNPVHSMRITIELFSRLASGEGDTSSLLNRAARYVGPAESGLQSLLRQTERLATYLCPASQPSLQPIEANAWLAEIAALAKESTRGLAVEVKSTLDDEIRIEADRPRVSHAVLRWILSHAAAPAVLQVRMSESGRIEIVLNYAAQAAEADAAPLTRVELHTLIENAGGDVLDADVSAGMTLSFARAP